MSSPTPSTMKDDKKRDPAKIGSIRPSQTIHTYGPGAIVEMPYMSVIIPGLDISETDPWQTTRGVFAASIEEPRLLATVRRDLGPQLTELRAAPWMESLSDNRVSTADWVGIWSMPFPRWLRCTSCHLLSRVDGGLFEVDIPLHRPDEAGWWHQRCPKVKGRKARALPVRFVLACRNGHLDDFSWAEWAHRRSGYVCPAGAGAQQLKLLDSGYAQRPTSQKVRCEACLSEETMTLAFGRDSADYLPACPGGRPHLNDYEPNGCGLETRALLVGASNIWFAARRSALSIPHQSRPVEQAVVANWTDLEQLEDRGTFEQLAASISHLPMGSWLTDERYTLDELWDEFERHRDANEDEETGTDTLLGPEWSALTTSSGTRYGRDFAVEAPEKPVSRFEHKINNVHLVTRLREVVAITGFTRLDAYDPSDTSPAAVRQARLADGKPTWVPAVQSRGEGVLVTLQENALQVWEADLVARSEGRHQLMRDAHRSWRERRGLDPAGGQVSNRFVLLHTLSHLLINAVSLRSGYATASIRERIYCRDPGDGAFPMAGILLYTASVDSEGTLGGLVSIGRPEVLGPLIDEAIENARVCSSDPFCAAHAPNSSIDSSDQGDGTLHGAACHVCLFLPETSCDHANRYLDRAYTVPTLTTSEIAFFL